MEGWLHDIFSDLLLVFVLFVALIAIRRGSRIIAERYTVRTYTNYIPPHPGGGGSGWSGRGWGFTEKVGPVAITANCVVYICEFALIAVVAMVIYFNAQLLFHLFFIAISLMLPIAIVVGGVAIVWLLVAFCVAFVKDLLNPPKK